MRDNPYKAEDGDRTIKHRGRPRLIPTTALGWIVLGLLCFAVVAALLWLVAPIVNTAV